MSESSGGWRRHRSLWRPKVQQDVDEELEFHLGMRTQEFMQAGMPEEEAQRVARERYGDLREIRSELVGIDQRQRRRVAWTERFSDRFHDLAIAVRTLRREPRFALGVIFTLALGIAANATMFGVVDHLLLRGPDGVANAREMRRLYTSWIGPQGATETTSYVGYVVYAALRDQARGLAGVGAYQQPGMDRFGADANPRLVATASATWDLFPALGVRPQLGRFFTQAEDTPGQTANVAVISDALWQDEFARDPDVIGKSVTVEDVRYTVVGVAPAGFNGPERSRTDIWLPMTLTHPCPNWTTTLNCQWMQVVTRVAPGVSAEQADAEATRVLRIVFASGDPEMRTVRGLARPLWYDEHGAPAAVGRVSEWLMGVSIIVLLITCANVANLLMARARRRRREIAVRLAIGAGASRLIWLVLAEAVLLGLAGGLVALGLSLLGGRVMRATLLAGMTLDATAVDPRVFAFTFALATLVAVAVGVISAAGSLRVDLTAGLRESANAGGGQRHRARAMLSSAQAALSVVLLIGAALFELSLYRSQHVPLGFEAQNVLRASVRFPASAHLAGPTADRDAERKAENALLVRVVTELATKPWVEHAAVAVGSPFGNSFTVDLRVPGRDSIPQLKGGGPYISAVTSDYFASVGTPLLRGRLFGPQERDGTAPVAIVNETMARILWPGEDALTKCLIVGDVKVAPCARIVGVVADVHRNSISEPPTMQYYVPFGQERGIGGSNLMIRPRGDAQAHLEQTRKALAALSGVSDIRVKWMETLLDPEYAPYRLGATMFGIFGMLALIVASVGLYSVVAYLVADRTREIGVRLALGAGAWRILRQVLAGGAATAGVGVLAGLAAAALGARYVEPLLFQVHALNPGVFAVAGALMLAVALVATWVPARRASRVDPVTALRTE